MRRSIVAINSTVFFASIAQIIEGDPRPRCRAFTAQEIRSHHPAAEARKHTELAQQVVAAVRSGGDPELVVLVSPVVGVQKSDPSAVRRIGVHWELVRQFAVARVPVAEILLLTAERAITGSDRPGKAGVKPLEEWVERHFPAVTRPTRKTDDGTDIPDSRYRMNTVALAALGCIMAGVPIPRATPDVDPLPVTEDILRILKGGSNAPPEFRITPEDRPADLARHEIAAAEKISNQKHDMEFTSTAPLHELDRPDAADSDPKAATRRRLGGAEDAADERLPMGGAHEEIAKSANAIHKPARIWTKVAGATAAVLTAAAVFGAGVVAGVQQAPGDYTDFEQFPQWYQDIEPELHVVGPGNCYWTYST